MVRPMREIAELSVGRGMAPRCSKALVLDRLEARATGRPQPARGYLTCAAKLAACVGKRTGLALANEIRGLEVPDWMRLDAYRCTATRRITRSWQPISRAARGCSP